MKSENKMMKTLIRCPGVLGEEGYAFLLETPNEY
jgi:hypothetical protein